MVEANPIKFYFAKYFFLAFSVLQLLLATVFFFQFESSKHLFAALVFLTIGILLFYLFLIVSDKIRRVAVGKNKIVVIEGHRNLRFEWPEVKSLKIVPFFHLYKLRVKGKRKSIYFFPSKSIDPAFGLLSKDTSKMGEIVDKKKKDHGIK